MWGVGSLTEMRPFPATRSEYSIVNIEKLKEAFVEALSVGIERVDDSLSYGSAGWDSLAHMVLVSKIEAAFDIMLDTDDVIGMSDFAKAKEIVVRHGFTLDSV